MKRPFLLAAAFGALVCTLGDYLHATHDVLYYPHESLGPQAWWVPLLFFFASVAALGGANRARALLAGGAPPPDLSAKRLAGDCLAFATAYASTSFLHGYPTPLLAVLVAFWAARMLSGEPRWIVVLSLAMAGAGTSFEALWSALGFFHYRDPDFAGVPRWLPAIYLHVAPLAARMGAWAVRPPATSET